MRVVLAIATYRGDEAVEKLCSIATSAAGRKLFNNVIVVDSIDDGATTNVARRLADDGLSEYVRYYEFHRNLGAAGNLYYRLLLATGLRADWVFALNHDGELNLDTVERLADFAQHTDFGAVYPLRQIAPDCFDLTGLRRFPWLPKRVRSHRIEGKTVPVRWLSSNGALYSLRPVWDGARPAIGLWHGFEDYAYGLELGHRRYEQVVLNDAVLESRYDYRTISVPGGNVIVSDKPPWLAYYLSRNLLLIATRYFPGPILLMGSLLLITRELTLILAIRGQKLTRLRHLFRGIIDGVRGREGQILKPQPPAE